MNEIVSIVSTVGFPIAACLVCMWYVTKMQAAYREDIKALQTLHTEESKELANALNNNTVVIQKLADKLESGGI